MSRLKRMIGITGGVGSGKSSVLEILRREHGAHVIQADQVAKELMEPGGECYRRAVEYLGSGILREDGAIDRPRMAQIIFQDSQKRKGMDERLHPLVWRAIRQRAGEALENLVVIEAAIPGKEFRDNCQEIWYVYASREKRIDRLKASRGYSREKCLCVMDSQLSEEGFMAWCSRRIDNDGPVEETASQIRDILQQMDGESAI